MKYAFILTLLKKIFSVKKLLWVWKALCFCVAVGIFAVSFYLAHINDIKTERNSGTQELGTYYNQHLQTLDVARELNEKIKQKQNSQSQDSVDVYKKDRESLDPREVMQ